MMKIYEALYNPMIHESASATLSIHKTLKGAEMAIEFNKNETQREWAETIQNNPAMEESEWNFCRWWGIREVELQD